jgi:c-di-GMP-binding flagellar brake protein YcgR
MQLNTGEKVFYKTMPEVLRHEATVISAEGQTIVLDAGKEHGISAGQQIVLSSNGNQYFAEVVDRDRSTVTLRQTWVNSRSYFRVEDVVPLLARKVEAGERLCVSRSFPYNDLVLPGPAAAPGTDVNPQVWHMLANIHTMLGMILERLDLESEGLLRAEKKQVNMSATGMRFRTRERFEAGDILEVKMLLPARPPLGVIVYGDVIRADDAGNGEIEVALHFSEMSDELRNEIVQYSLMRQREIIRKSRE